MGRSADYEKKYMKRFGRIELEKRASPSADPLRASSDNATTTRNILNEWENASMNTACPCKLLKNNLYVWSNGYVTESSSVSFENYQELYVQRETLESISFVVQGHGLSSESDYAFSLFSSKLDAHVPLNATSLSSSLGFLKELVPNEPLSRGKYDDDSIIPALPKAIAIMRDASKDGVVQAFQTTDEYFCNGFAYIVNPTFVVAQREDGTVFGLVSTAIWT